MRRSLFVLIPAVALAGIVACATEPGGDPVDLSFAPCLGASDYPTWFAAQDGDGPWQQVTPTASGAFDFTIARGRGGIAMYSPDEGLYIVYASTDEMRTYFLACHGSVRTVVGAVTGYTAQDNIDIRMGTSRDVVFGTQAPPASFELTSVDATATDLVAVRYRSVFGTTTQEYVPDNVLIRRGVTGTSTAALNFASTTEAGAAVKRTLTVANIASGEELNVVSSLSTASTLAPLAIYEASGSPGAGAALAPFYGLSSARLVSGESQVLHVTAEKHTSATAGENRIATLAFTDAVDKTLTLGPALGAIAVTGGSRPSTEYTIQSEYANLWDVVFESIFSRAEVLMTRAYLGDAASVTLAVPNLSGVAGFQNSWLFEAGAPFSWAWLATNANLSILTSRPTAYQAAARGNTFTP
jgi:hypothetical protein